MKKKLCIVSLMILILINILTMSVRAALSFTISMVANNTKTEPGTEVVVSVKISSLDVGNEGINTFSAQLGYDPSIFEPLTETNIEGTNNWKAAYATVTGKITLTNTSFVNSDEEIMQITLKVKSDVQGGSKGIVSLSNVLAANPETEISSSNVSTTVTVGEANNSNPTEEPEAPVNVITPSNNIINNGVVNNQTNNKPTNNTVNKITNSGTLTPITNSNNTNNKVNSINTVVNEIDKSDDDMPYTGSETESFMKIILGMIIIALLIYRKIYSLEDI